MSANKQKRKPNAAELPIGRGIKGTLRIVKRGRRRLVTFRPSSR